MSDIYNQEWLENMREQFDVLMESPSLEEIQQAYQIILEVEAHGFSKESIDLEDEWSDITKEVAPNYYKQFKQDDYDGYGNK